MTIYFDYTAGRGKYDDDESCISKFEAKVIQDFKPFKKANQQSNLNQNKPNTYMQSRENYAKPNNKFYYSPEQKSDTSSSYKYRYNDQQNNQRNRKPFRRTQYYNKGQNRSYKQKNGDYVKQFQITLGSKYQTNDIED